MEFISLTINGRGAKATSLRVSAHDERSNFLGLAVKKNCLGSKGETRSTMSLSEREPRLKSQKQFVSGIMESMRA